MPRFVILEHDHPELHWDLMLEAGPALRTWRLPRPLGEAAEFSATALPDHRLTYLEYEGPVSGNRGMVRRWDAGTYSEQDPSSRQALVMHLIGERSRGMLRLEKADGDTWRCRWDATA